jgi:hypothetical protein
MKYFKDFFQYKKLSKIFEQEAQPKTKVEKTPYEEKMGDETFDIKARKRKKGKKLDYTLKYDSQDYKDHPWNGGAGIARGKAGSNYQTKWVKDVENAFNKPETREKMVEFLKNYRGQDYQTVQRMISADTSKLGEENLWKAMLKRATDGKVGPYHRIVWNGMIENKIPVPELPQYKVTTSSQPDGSGTTTGDGTFDEASSVTIEASASEGFTFVNWTENDQEVSKDSKFTFQISSDRNLVANFKKGPSKLPDDEDEDEDEDDDRRGRFRASDLDDERSINTDYARVLRSGDKVGPKLGEEEKLQRRIEIPQGDNKEKILFMNYPKSESTLYECGECGGLADVLLNKCPGCNAVNTFKERDLKKEDLTDSKVRLGRVENLTDTIDGDKRVISFNCVLNRNEYLKDNVYVYLFYQRPKTNKKEEKNLDLGVMRKVIKGGKGQVNFTLVASKKNLIDWKDAFFGNVFFSTQELDFGKDKLVDGKPLKLSKDNPQLAALIDKLGKPGKDGMIRSFLNTIHKGPLYSTAKVESSPE